MNNDCYGVTSVKVIIPILFIQCVMKPKSLCKMFKSTNYVIVGKIRVGQETVSGKWQKKDAGSYSHQTIM